ncbi:hypothetical protein C8263_04125 [Deinococcus arcticus]|uniref:Uncharacterized protein n=1 Tax=Deinococcus arcticus TaxID=2136176 RepID=A0A2T3WB78_9DEIO|nr:hypothetical protein C8263_04125 [Deinococcus arcticus]
MPPVTPAPWPLALRRGSGPAQAGAPRRPRRSSGPGCRRRPAGRPATRSPRRARRPAGLPASPAGPASRTSRGPPAQTRATCGQVFAFALPGFQGRYAGFQFAHFHDAGIRRRAL